MVRCALTAEADPEMAEGLLRYYARKPEPSELDRDKTDLIATFLYRNPRVPGQWERRGYALDGILPIPPFEIALTEILSDGEVPPLSGEEMQCLADLDILRAKAEIFRDFGAFLDSGLTQNIRELKRALGFSFYHPTVLANLAPLNVAVGKKIDTLFRAASFEIKKFAESVEERGGNIVGQVDGVDVTVDLVAAMNEDEILNTDYGISVERFRRVVKLKKSLEGQPKVRAAAAGVESGPAPFVHVTSWQLCPVNCAGPERLFVSCRDFRADPPRSSIGATRRDRASRRYRHVCRSFAGVDGSGHGCLSR